MFPLRTPVKQWLLRGIGVAGVGLLLGGCVLAPVDPGWDDYGPQPYGLPTYGERYSGTDGLVMVYEPGPRLYRVEGHPDLYWRDNRFYRRHEGRWEWSEHHGGPWGHPTPDRHPPPSPDPERRSRHGPGDEGPRAWLPAPRSPEVAGIPRPTGRWEPRSRPMVDQAPAPELRGRFARPYSEPVRRTPTDTPDSGDRRPDWTRHRPDQDRHDRRQDRRGGSPEARPPGPQPPRALGLWQGSERGFQ